MTDSVLGVPRAFGLLFVQVAARVAAFCKPCDFYSFFVLGTARTFFFVASSITELSQLAPHPLGRLDDSFLAPRQAAAQTLCARSARRDEPPAVETQIRQRAGEPSSTNNDATAARGNFFLNYTQR